MSFYLDTAVLVSVLVREDAGPRARTWLHEHQDRNVFISDWVVTEFSSAVSRKRRDGTIADPLRLEVLTRFVHLRRTVLSTLPVTRQAFEVAARFADQYALGVRSGEALHLAIAAEHGLTICTLDKRLAEAGPKLGVATVRL